MLGGSFVQCSLVGCTHCNGAVMFLVGVWEGLFD